MYKVAILTTLDDIVSDDASIRLVDARTAEEYAGGHIPGAVNLPAGDLDREAATTARLAGSLGISSDTSVVIYDDSFGMAAAMVAWSLEYAGHSGVSMLECTYSEWLKTNREPANTVTDVGPVKYAVNIRSGMVATMDDIKDSPAVLVDTRRRLDFLELHITGTVSVPHRAVSRPGAVLRDVAELLHLFGNRGIGVDSDVITYDDGPGPSSALVYYALKRAGLEKVRMYLASFGEWRDRGGDVSTQQNAAYRDISA